MVSPPPGVSSASRVPPMASAKPRATARPEAHAGAARGVAVPLEGGEDPVLGLVGHAGAAVDDPHLDPVAEGAGGDQHRRARPGCT